MSRREYGFDALALNAMFGLFEENGFELVDAVERFLKIPENGEPDTACWDRLRVVGRRLHNWLSSAYSFQQACRALPRVHAAHVSSDFLSAFKPRFAKCFDAPVSSFVIQLRAFQQHYRVPVTSGFFRRHERPDGEIELQSGVYLTVQSLEVPGRRWKGASADYLRRHPNGISLLQLEREFRLQVEPLMAWLKVAIQAEVSTASGYLTRGR